MANLGQSEFQQRIKRINNPRNNSYYDPDMKMHVPKRLARPQPVKKASEGNQMLSAALVAMVIGGAAMFCAQVVRVRYLGMVGGSPAISFTDLLVGLWIMLMFSALMKRRGFLARLGQFAGLGLMMVVGHNLVWKWPEVMTSIFSPEHVAYVTSHTSVGSALIHGTVYAF
ncbi:hypothetical protein [Loktanella sp. S4079]|uniref:hypothetical protein n=1 Tax=Loktanella sp. S4079 TaxID=579483 RepID=UPI0005FA3FBA|nr:hypothetical protein [Loktanella sp. S4079]KJZ20240.1 hypothetical protein TW80_05280 [Loktanella sp. S4079]